MIIPTDAVNVTNRYFVTKDGVVFSKRKSVREKKQFVTELGYCVVHICDGSGCCKYIGVHQLVAQAFIPNPENKPQVNHKDGNKRNNSVENLEWATAKENIQHAIRTGLRKPRYGNAHHSTKISADDILDIRLLRIFGARCKDLAESYGLNQVHVSGICRGVKRKNG